ncbi:hypothetical protein BVZ56_01639B, partial [Haemophilus influenzae]
PMVIVMELVLRVR